MMPLPAGNRSSKIKQLSVADGFYKSLGSLPVPRYGRTVQSMDSLTARELEGSVIQDSPTAARLLGYTIDTIFGSFARDVESILPLDSVDSLTVPWDSIPQQIQVVLSAGFPQAPQGTWTMYDSNAKRWRWPFELPVANGPAIPSPTATATPPTTSPPATHDTTLTAPKKLEPPTSEQLVAGFFNSVALAVRTKAPSIVKNDTKRHWMAEWSRKPMPGSSGYIRMPDLVLVDNAALTVDEISWWSPKVLGEYTKETFQPAKRLGKTMDTKAYLTFLEQPWRRFVLGLSICNSVEIRLHFYDRSGGVISPAFNMHMHPERLIYILSAVTFGCRGCIGFDVTTTIKPVPARIRGLLAFLSNGAETPSSIIPSPQLSTSSSTSSLLPSPTDNPKSHPTIGTILVGDDLYWIVDILFSSPSFLGRGTICYLTRRKNMLYVIKDHWLRLSPHREVLNEVSTMEKLRHIPGVPKIHSHWIVVADSVNDNTEKYREPKWRSKMKARRIHLRLVMTPYARPLMMFKTKKELVSSLRDIIGVLEQAADAGILHRDCSLHNAAIEDLDSGGSRGLLLDWEFGVEVTGDERYSVGGTGTLPFLSVNLLDQIRELVRPASGDIRASRKTLSNTCVFLDDDSTVKHTHSDDVESLFYVLLWIMIMYDGPLGHQCANVDPNSTILGHWIDDTAANLRAASDAKSTLFLRESRWKEFQGQVSPYFQDLLPLVDRWRKTLAGSVEVDTSRRVNFSDTLRVFDDFLPTMRKETSAEMTRALQDIQADYTKFIMSATGPIPTSTSDTTLPNKRLVLSDGIDCLRSRKRSRRK